MKKIVILGNSAASIKLIESIRAGHLEAEITLISFDGNYPYKRDYVVGFMEGKISSNQLACQTKEFYKQNRVDVVLDLKITRINFKRKKIFTEDKKQIDYDVLLITDTPQNRFKEIKGINKGSVLGLVKLSDIHAIMKDLSFADTIVIESDSFSGIKTAVALAGRGKEIILICSKKNFLVSSIESRAREWLLENLFQKNVRVISENEIVEILGEKEVKAVRLKTGKVFSAQMVIFGEQKGDMRIFSDSDLEMDGRVYVDDQFKTNIEDVFACDYVCGLKDHYNVALSEHDDIQEIFSSSTMLDEQGRVVASAIEGKEDKFSFSEIDTFSLEKDGFSIILLGQTRISEGIRTEFQFNEQNQTYQKFFIENDCLVGAILINMKDRKDKILEAISTRKNIVQSDILTEEQNEEEKNVLTPRLFL